MSFSGNKSEYNKLEKWLENFTALPVTKEDFEIATKLAVMYRCKNPSINLKQISLIDFLHAATLVKYKNNVFIVTTDINDYPSFLFDTPKYIPIEESAGNTTFVGFKTFNNKKYEALCNAFKKTH